MHLATVSYSSYSLPHSPTDNNIQNLPLQVCDIMHTGKVESVKLPSKSSDLETVSDTLFFFDF